MGHDPPHSSQVIARKRAVFALRAEFSSLSFPKEKETKKKENLRACALKNPPHCTELSCSIKNGMFVVTAITGRASRDEIYEARKERQEKKEMWVRPSVARRACTDITSSAQEPSPRYTVTFGSSCTVIFDQVRKGFGAH